MVACDSDNRGGRWPDFLELFLFLNIFFLIRIILKISEVNLIMEAGERN